VSQSNEWRGIIRGILLAVLLATAIVTIAFLLFSIPGLVSVFPALTWGYTVVIFINFAAYSIGITQLLYILPLLIVFWRQRRFALMKGLIIGAVIIALLNFGCFLYVLSRFGDR